MCLRFSRFASSQKPDGYRTNNGCESEHEAKGRQVLEKRGIHLFDLWEWVRYEINSSSVTEFSPNSLDSMPLLAFPGPAILVSRIVGLYFLKANRADEDPFLRFVDTNSIENIISLLTTRT